MSESPRSRTVVVECSKHALTGDWLALATVDGQHRLFALADTEVEALAAVQDYLEEWFGAPGEYLGPAHG